MHPLLRDLVDGRADLEAVRAALVAAGGPLREMNGDGTLTLTFVWVGAAPSVTLHCGLARPSGSVAMTPVAGADVWWAALVADPDALVSYRFVIDDPFADAGPLDELRWQQLMLLAQQRSFADPSNPRRIAPLASLFGLDIPPAQFESVLALRDAPAAPWFEPHEAPEGAVLRFTLTSTAMGSSRDVTVWTPPGATTGHPLVVLLDGPSFLQLGGIDRAVASAVARSDLRAPVVAFVHEAHGTTGLDERTRELSCNQTHAAMLTDELIPELRRRFPVSSAPGDTVLGGASLGGLASAYTASERPDVVGNVLSVSGSFWYGTERDGTPEWLTRRLRDRPVPGLRWYQQIGRYEDNPLDAAPGVTHLQANRHLHELLVEQGVDVMYEEMGTAHDACAFRVAVLHGLRALLPR